MIRERADSGRTRAAGYSLIELLMVTAMTGIIFSIAIPQYL